MASYYWFRIGTDPSTDFVLDNSAISITMPGMSRSYNKVDLYSDGAIIQGAGQMMAQTIQFTKTFRAQPGDPNTFTPKRTQVMSIMGVPKYIDLFLFIMDASGDMWKAKVYPLSISGESYTTFRISTEATFTFQMQNGYFEAVDQTLFTKALASTALDTVTVVNGGILEVPPVISLKLTANCSLFQVQLAEGFGFTIEGGFLAGQTLAYDCATAIVTVDGGVSNGSLASGSVFKLPPGQSTLSIYGQTGILSVTFYERSI